MTTLLHKYEPNGSPSHSWAYIPELSQPLSFRLQLCPIYQHPDTPPNSTIPLRPCKIPGFGLEIPLTPTSSPACVCSLGPILIFSQQPRKDYRLLVKSTNPRMVRSWGLHNHLLEIRRPISHPRIIPERNSQVRNILETYLGADIGQSLVCTIPRYLGRQGMYLIAWIRTQ